MINCDWRKRESARDWMIGRMTWNLLIIERKKRKETSLSKKDGDEEVDRTLRISGYTMIKEIEMIVEKLVLEEKFQALR